MSKVRSSDILNLILIAIINYLDHLPILLRGWIKECDLLVFDSDSFVKYFDEKKFRIDISYRTALIEAVRIAAKEGIEFETETFKMISTFKVCTH